MIENRGTAAVTVREWNRSDLPVVRQITWVTWLATYASFIPVADMEAYFASRYTPEDLTKLFESPNIRCAVAECDGAVVGFGRTQYNSQENRIYLSSLYVLPSFQGKGIGMKLVREAEGVARLLNLDEIWLGVMVDNVDALAWYRKIGFFFEREEPFVMGGTTVSHLIGFKKITV
jgi:ribosomal protein S18 acetylase RimI-like enzyme